jgi:hypothetical protein
MSSVSVSVWKWNCVFAHVRTAAGTYSSQISGGSTMWLSQSKIGKVLVMAAGYAVTRQRSTMGYAAAGRISMKLRHLIPLAAHIVPTIAIGFGYVIPGSCIAGLNELTIGFAASIASTIVAYMIGIRLVVRDLGARVR